MSEDSELLLIYQYSECIKHRHLVVVGVHLLKPIHFVPWHRDDFIISCTVSNEEYNIKKYKNVVVDGDF